MIDLGEHIEEVIKIDKENGTPLNPDDIAEGVLDIAYAQGLVQESELELAHKQVSDQVRYMLGVD
jgi:hypothetical protein